MPSQVRQLAVVDREEAVPMPLRPRLARRGLISATLAKRGPASSTGSDMVDVRHVELIFNILQQDVRPPIQRQKEQEDEEGDRQQQRREPQPAADASRPQHRAEVGPGSSSSG
jgi:hypothetical protein